MSSTSPGSSWIRSSSSNTCATKAPAARQASPAAFFYKAFLSILDVSYLTVLLVTREFDNYRGYYTAFGQNLLMPGLFIRLLLDRKDLAGQSLYIGLAKMLGTFCASILVVGYAPVSQLTVFFAWAILFFDLAYIGMYIQKSRRLGVNTHLRW